MSKSLITNASTAMHEIKNLNSSKHILRFTPDMIKDERVLEIEKSFIDKMNTGDSSRAISGDVRSRRKMPANS